MTSSAPEGGFGIYVHWPFCVSKCPYCDFNSHVRSRFDEERWVAAILAELDHYASFTAGRVADSVFFGGGTPSLMDPSSAAVILGRIRRLWKFTPDTEITLEANPSSAEAERFDGFRGAGVDRLSIGVQSLDPAALRFLGRAHGREEAVRAIRWARDVFPRMSFDLIYARPGQSSEAWLRELDEALDLAADHLSVYQLTIEPGTAFHTAYGRNAFTLPTDELAGELYELTQSRLERAGMPAYEISNHARAGAESRHNLIYWRYGDYVGVGPGAHGRITRDGVKAGYRQKKLPETWLSAVEESGHGTEEITPISDEERRIEFLMMGLRLTEGISLPRFHTEWGCEPEQAFGSERLRPLLEGGFVALDNERIKATAAGHQRLNAVLAHLLD